MSDGKRSGQSIKVAVVGTGYVGLVTGTCFAEMGNTVVCVDIDAEKVERMREGRVPGHWKDQYVCACYYPLAAHSYINVIRSAGCCSWGNYYDVLETRLAHQPWRTRPYPGEEVQQPDHVLQVFIYPL